MEQVDIDYIKKLEQELKETKKQISLIKNQMFQTSITPNHNLSVLENYEKQINKNLHTIKKHKRQERLHSFKKRCYKLPLRYYTVK